MSYIDRLNAMHSQKQPRGSLTQPTERLETVEVSVVSVGSGGAFIKPQEALATWRAHLGRLDGDSPLHGLDRLRWRQLLGDAQWLLAHFGQQAARDGWSAHDLFGRCGRDGWGGIADRLWASRTLVMGSEVATWRRVINGEPDTFPRGLGQRSGFNLLWESGQ